MPRTPTELRPENTRTSPTGKRIARPFRAASLIAHRASSPAQSLRPSHRPAQSRAAQHRNDG
jgi:hypothetical protein